MKQLLFSIALLSLVACKHDPSEVQITEQPFFDLNKAIGIWVPYEYILNDTLLVTGPFTTMSIFGAYDESVEIRADKTFVPVIWFSNTNIIKSETEGGPVLYNATTNELHFDNALHLKGIIRKFDGKQLWIQTSYILYRFEKKG